VRVKTNTETMGARHERVVDALAELEQAAQDYSTTNRAASPRKRLAKAALDYAARVRRMAGVR
jgi:hypothetical protein